MKSKLQISKVDTSESISFPVFSSKVKANTNDYGSFESAALDFPDDTIDLLKILIKDKETVFFAKVSGDSLNGIEVYDDYLLIIQKGMLYRRDDVIDFFSKRSSYTN